MSDMGYLYVHYQSCRCNEKKIINANSLIQIKVKKIKRKQVLLKSYFTLNYNCKKKKKELSEDRPAHFEKKSPVF